MQQVDFIDDDETDELGVSAIPTFTSDDIPFFRSGDDELCFRDL